jgi:hypothetical protein
MLFAACDGREGARVPTSPLPAPPRGAISPLPSPRTLILVTPRGYLPRVAGGRAAYAEDGCSRNAVAAEMLRLIRKLPDQGRANVVCDARLAAAADWKARQMAAHVYASHITIDGDSPNDYVRAFGYPLPEWYAPGANQVESFGAGYPTAEAMLAAWRTSQSHWTHVTAAHSFFVGQECAAVGYASTPGWAWQDYWVFLSAPCP